MLRPKPLLIASIALFIGFVASRFAGASLLSGGFLSVFWVVLALLARTHEVGKLFCFPLFVLGCLTSSMCFPGLYLNWYFPKFACDWSAFQFSVDWGPHPATQLVNPILQMIMFAMGTQLRGSDFAQVVRQPWAVVVGVAAQFLIMPIVGYTIAKTTNFPPEIAAGIILIGCVPSGIASNVMNYIGKLNVALSVTLTACATLLGPIFTPLWLKALAGRTIEMNIWDVSWGMIVIVVLPILVGVAFRVLFPKLNAKLEKTYSFLSMVGILLTIVWIVAAGRDALLSVGLALVLACVAHNFIGYSLGYWLARLCGIDKRSCRTIAIEVGMQNAGLGAGLATSVFKSVELGLAPTIFSPVMNTSGSTLAIWWRRRPVEDDAKDGETGKAPEASEAPEKQADAK